MMKIISERIKSALIVVLVCLTLGLGAASWYNHASNLKTQNTVHQLETRAATLERDNKELQAKFDKTMQTLKTISEKQASITGKQNQMMKELKDVSEKSKEYLATPIPDDVRRVLDSLFDDHTP